MSVKNPTVPDELVGSVEVFAAHRNDQAVVMKMAVTFLLADIVKLQDVGMAGRTRGVGGTSVYAWLGRAIYNCNGGSDEISDITGRAADAIVFFGETIMWEENFIVALDLLLLLLSDCTFIIIAFN